MHVDIMMKMNNRRPLFCKTNFVFWFLKNPKFEEKKMFFNE